MANTHHHFPHCSHPRPDDNCPSPLPPLLSPTPSLHFFLPSTPTPFPPHQSSNNNNNMNDPAMAPVGTGRVVGGRYREVRKIGCGSFGSIYLGVSNQSGEEVAIKREQVSSRHPQSATEDKKSLPLPSPPPPTRCRLPSSSIPPISMGSFSWACP